ncbi:MAG: C40 family peptidase [Romboutsia sp.]|nr:C40 family peptidase [Romboutsia sp.]
MIKVFSSRKFKSILAVLAIFVCISNLTNEAYASSKSTKLSSNQKIEKVISLANKQLGKKYKYGATGPKNFDCSGLTYYCFKNAVGQTIPRTSSQQSKKGKYISISKLKRGDLVFFGNKKTKKVSHVALYIGNNKFIHSPKPGDVVRIDSMKTSYYKNRALHGRRFFGN